MAVLLVVGSSLDWMDLDEKLGAVIEAFQAISYGEGFEEGAFVNQCYDHEFSPGMIGEDVFQNLHGFTVDILKTLSLRMLEYLRDVSIDPEQRVENILITMHGAQIPLKELLAALCAFIHSGVKTSKDNGVTVRGALAAAVYFLLLAATKGNIPAALHQPMNMTKLLIPPLFNKGIDILLAPSMWKSAEPVAKKTGRGRKQVCESFVSLLNRFKRSIIYGQAHPDHNSELDEEPVDTTVQWPEAESILLKALVAFVRNLDGLPFHLGRLARSLAIIWSRDFPEDEFTFDQAAQVDNLDSVSDIAGKCLSLLLVDKTQNGQIVLLNLRLVLFALLPSALRLADDSATITTFRPTIPRGVDSHAGKVEKFIIQLIRSFPAGDEIDTVWMAFMQHLFLNVPESQEYRRRSALTIVHLLVAMHNDLRNKILQWIVMESEADRMRGRQLGLEVVSVAFDQKWKNCKMRSIMRLMDFFVKKSSTIFIPVDIPYLKVTTVEHALWTVCMDRMKDKVSRVRKVAGTIFKSLMDGDLAWLESLKRPADTQNGYQDPIAQIFPTVLAGCSDVSATARQTFVQLLGKLLLMNFDLFNMDVKDVLLRSAQDPAKSVRQANIEVICSLVTVVDQAVFCDMWIRGVFRLYMDSEETIKETVLSAFKTTVFDPIVSTSVSSSTTSLSWEILKKICGDELGDLRLLRQLFQSMAKERKQITAVMLGRIEKYLSTPFASTAWRIIAELSRIVKEVNGQFAVDFVHNKTFEGEDDLSGASAYQVVQSMLQTSKKDVNEYKDFLIDEFPSIRGVATVVEAIRAIHMAYDHRDVNQLDQFKEWGLRQLQNISKELQVNLQDYQQWLAEGNSSSDVTETDLETRIAFAVRTIGELGKHVGIGPKGIRLDGNVRDTNPLRLVLDVCDFEGDMNYRPWVRAHGVFALGRLCLAAKKWAWEHTESIVKLADGQNTDKGLRRDAIIVVFDLLKMFGEVVEPHLGKVYGWLGDSCIEIRGDVIYHLQNLLLNEHMQWNPTVLYQFLTSICDPDENIRDSVRTCLRSLIKKRSQFYTDFVEALVFLPACTVHPRFKAAAVADSHNASFPLMGRANTDRRMEIYGFMVKQMNHVQKKLTVNRILEQILVPVVTVEVDIKSAINHRYRDVLLDVMKVLELKEMMDFTGDKEAEEGAEEGEDGEGEVETAEEAVQRQNRKQSKEEQKELWKKFRKEISRYLIPVLAYVYRQLKDLASDPALLEASISVVEMLTRISELNLEEESQQTGGTDGQIFKALAIDIKRLQAKKKAAMDMPRAGAASVESNVDDIPLVRESPTGLSRAQTATPTVATQDLPVPPTDQLTKNQSRLERESSSSTIENDPHATMVNVSQSARVAKRTAASKVLRSKPSTVDTSKRDRSATSAASTPAPKRPTRNVMGNRDPAENVTIVPTRSKSHGNVSKKPVEKTQVPTVDDADETLKNASYVIPRSSEAREVANEPVSTARAISTPVATRTRRNLNLTFGSDISEIQGGDRTMLPPRSVARRPKK